MGLRETDGIFGGGGAQSGEAALRGKSSKWRRSSSEKRLGKRCFKGIWIPRLYNNNNNNNNNIKLGYKLVGVDKWHVPNLSMQYKNLNLLVRECFAWRGDKVKIVLRERGTMFTIFSQQIIGG